MSSRKTMWDELKDREFAHAYFDEFVNTFIATQLKVLREQRGLRQAELAQLAGMAQERICVMENVNYSSWTVNTLRRLAKALGVRLRVSFETFSSGVQETKQFTPENLQRDSLDEELEARFNPKPVAADVMQAAFASAATSNSLDTIKPDLRFVQLRGQLPSITEEESDETTFDRTSASPLAFPPYGLKSARESNREKWPH